MKSTKTFTTAAAVLLMCVGCGSNEFTPREPLSTHSDEFKALFGGAGLTLFITNALQFPPGAHDVPTACHLNARLCGKQDKENYEANESLYPNCFDLPGTINASTTEIFHLSPQEAIGIVNPDNRELALLLKSSCQVSDQYFPVGATANLEEHLDRYRQTVRYEIERARWWGYDATVQGARDAL